MQANWQAGFLYELAGPVKVTRRRRVVADLANRLILGLYMQREIDD